MYCIGIDEVGRGSLAGPMVVGAVSLLEKIPGITDSKKLSKIQRQLFDIEIKKRARYWSIGWVWPNEIDLYGLTKAEQIAITRALTPINRHIDRILIDGNFNYLFNDSRVTTIINGDQIDPDISAASIIAKVTRDSFMSNIHYSFEEYQFNRNFGYGTKFHINAIERDSESTIHRALFLRKIKLKVLHNRS